MEGVFLAIAATQGAFRTATWGDIGFHTDDRLDPDGLGFFEKFHGSVEVAVIGDGHGRHPEFLALGNQFRHPVGAVQQAIVSVAMKMDTWLVSHRKSLVPRVGESP